MLVMKNVGVWVKHMRKSVMARLMIKMLDGVRKLRLLNTHTHTHTHTGRNVDISLIRG